MLDECYFYWTKKFCLRFIRKYQRKWMMSYVMSNTYKFLRLVHCYFEAKFWCWKRNIVSTLKAFISNAINFLGIFASALKRCFRLIPWNHFPFHVHIHFSTFLLFFTSMIRWGLHHILLNFHYAWWHVLFDIDVSLVPHS